MVRMLQICMPIALLTKNTYAMQVTIRIFSARKPLHPCEIFDQHSLGAWIVRLPPHNAVPIASQPDQIALQRNISLGKACTRAQIPSKPAGSTWHHLGPGCEIGISAQRCHVVHHLFSRHVNRSRAIPLTRKQFGARPRVRNPAAVEPQQWR